jgi:hypothetical protein
VEIAIRIRWEATCAAAQDIGPFEMLCNRSAQFLQDSSSTD